MADITATPAQIAPVFSGPGMCEVYDHVAGATITKGQPVYLDTNGVLQVADASLTGTAQVIGIALNGAGAGQAVSVLHHGCVYGYTLTGAYYALVYLSNTAGSLSTTVGAVTVYVGRVWPLADASPGASSVPTKVLMVDCAVQHTNYV